MRYPGATWYPTTKHGYFGLGDSCLRLGVVMHSMEGDLATALGMLDDPEVAKSWHFSVAADGAVFQHIDTDGISWASGGFGANQRFWSIEHEGWAGESLTDAQYAASAALVGWLLEMHGLAPVRGETLWEHNEMTRFGSAPTACPSGRIPWGRLLADLTKDQGEDDMKLTLIGNEWGTVYVITPEGRKTPIVSIEHFNALFELGLIAAFDPTNPWDDVQWVRNELADQIPDA